MYMNSCLVYLSIIMFKKNVVDGSCCWVVHGSHVEVLDTRTGARRAAWQFGKVTEDAHTRVTCVQELCPPSGAGLAGVGGAGLQLLVGVCNSSPHGLLCVLDVPTAKVTKAVEIPYPVSSLLLTHHVHFFFDQGFFNYGDGVIGPSLCGKLM